MIQIEKDQTIYFYEIKVDFKNNVATKQVKELKVIGANSSYLVVDNFDFTKLIQPKEKESVCYMKVDKPHVYHFNLLSYYDEMTVTIYTAKKNDKKNYIKLKEELEKYIYEKHGRYCNSIDILKTLNLED